MSLALKSTAVAEIDYMKRTVFVHMRKSKEVIFTRYDIFKFFEKYGKIKYLAMGEKAEHFTGNCYITFEEISSAEAAIKNQDKHQNTPHTSNHISQFLTVQKYTSDKKSNPKSKHKADFLYSLDYFLTNNDSESLKCKFNYASMAKMFAKVSQNQ